MWSILTQLLPKVNHFKPKNVIIDNWVFRLHYRLTFLFLLITVAVLWSTEHFGEKIQCTHFREEVGYRIPMQLDKVINTWCYFMGVFTIPRHHSINSTNKEVHYAGVGPFMGEEPIRKLGWYQWVYYVLFLQAFAFYLPHMFWKATERRTIQKFANGIANLSALEENTRKKTFEDVKKGMLARFEFHHYWAHWLCFFEFANLINLIIQWFLTDWFLQGNFSNLGYALTEKVNATHSFSTLDIAFPKMAKCTYNKIGQTGQVQNTDILCVMTYNIVYEKVYLILWLWYITLMTISAIAVVHRALSWLLHRKSQISSNFVLVSSVSIQGDLDLITKNLLYSEWLFFQYLISNLPESIVPELVTGIADEIRAKQVANFNHNDKNTVQSINYKRL